MRSKKIPGPSAKGKPGKRNRQKFYRPYFNKTRFYIPPEIERLILHGNNLSSGNFKGGVSF